MSSAETVKVVGSYSEGCFCEGRRRALTPLTGVRYRPFHFFRAATQFCEMNGLRWGGLNGGPDRSAWAIDPVPCSHRAEQRVRIDWGLEYV